MNRLFIAILILLGLSSQNVKSNAQARDFTAVRAGVFFDQTLRDWDGFGFNYVESAHFVNINHVRS